MEKGGPYIPLTGSSFSGFGPWDPGVHEIGRKFLTRINSKSSLDFEKPQEVQTCPDFSLDGDSRKIAL